MTQATLTNQHFFINVTGNLFSAVSRGKNKSVDQAIDEAFAIFAKRNPEWVDNLFDQHFIEKRVKPVVGINAKRGRKVSAIDVAMMWDAQFSNQSFDRRQQHVNQLVADAELFIRELKARLN